MSTYVSRGVERPARVRGGVTSKAEGDRIAAMVLAVVRTVANDDRRHKYLSVERNVRPEPPEATLGFLPRGWAA